MGENRKHLCPCGSGRRMKACCRTLQHATKLELEETALRLSKEGRHREAIEVFEKRLALSPNNPMIWNDLGNEYGAVGQFEEALVALKRGYAIDPKYPLPLYNLGVHTLAHCKELEKAGLADKAKFHDMVLEAIGYFNAFLERDPDHADCHQSIATAYRMIHDTHRAGAHTLEALRLNPGLQMPAKGLLKRALSLLSR
jgi:tetratricopeptide (TPR) repeat protein